MEESNIETNENKKNNVALYIVAVVIILLIGIGIGYYLYGNKEKSVNNNEKPINNSINNNEKPINKKENNNNESEKEKSSDVIDFSEVRLSKLSAVKNYFFEGDVEDFSKWYLLDEDDNYVTLIGGMNFKISSDEALNYESDKLFLEKYGIDFGKDGFERLLNEQDLKKYFECDLELMKCNKMGISTLTSVKKNNGVIEIDGKNLSIFEFNIGLANASPIIKILKSNLNDNKDSVSMICTADTYDKLEIFDMENKTEKIGAIGGSKIGYNVTTNVTKNHNYNSTPNNDELYSNDMEGTLYILYKNKLYYTKQKETISKYCETTEINSSIKLKCDYSKISDNVIKEFNAINIDISLKSIGAYGDSGSGSPMVYAVTNDGKVINLPNALSNNYSNCGVMYDSSKYPIDRIFNMHFYDGVEYTILLKNGTLITRDVDRENPIEYEH